MAENEKISTRWPEETISSRRAGPSLPQTLDQMFPGLGKWLMQSKLGQVLSEGQEEISPEDLAMNFGPGAIARITPAQLRGGVLAKHSGGLRKQMGDELMALVQEKVPKSIRNDPNFQVNRPLKEAMQAEYERILQETGRLEKGEAAAPIGGLYLPARHPSARKAILGSGQLEPINTAFVPLGERIGVTKNTLGHEIEHHIANEATRGADIDIRLAYEQSMEPIANLGGATFSGRGPSGEQLSNAGLAALRKRIPPYQEGLVSHINEFKRQGWLEDKATARNVKAAWQERQQQRAQALQTAVKNEFDQMMAYKQSGQPIMLRKGGSKTLAPKAGGEEAVPEIPGLRFHGIQQLPNKPDQYVFTDELTKSTFYSPDLDPSGIRAQRDAMRKTFDMPIGDATDPRDLRFDSLEIARETKKNLGFVANSIYKPKDLFIKKTPEGYKFELTREAQKNRPMTGTEIEKLRAEIAKRRLSRERGEPNE